MGTTMYTPLQPAGYQSITATSAGATGFTITAATAASATQPEPNYAIIVAQSASARWRDDGTAPTVGFGGGVALPTNLIFQYDGKIRGIQFITDTGTSYIGAALYRAGP